MNLTKYEQLDLIHKIEVMVGSIGDYLYGDGDNTVNKQIACIEKALSVLKQSFYDENTYIKLRDRETGKIEYRYFEKGDVGALCHKASEFYAWSDYDNTYEIVEIMCNGKKLRYLGWQPDMLFEFVNEDGDVVYSANFPQWEH